MDESAFPQIQTEYSQGDHEYNGNVFSTGGMTLRDYFAAAALQALITTAPNADYMVVADDAYQYAKAMLKARK